MKIKLPNEIETERLTLKKHCLFLNQNGRLQPEYVQLWVNSINQNREWLGRFLSHFDEPYTFEKEETFLNDLISEKNEIAYGIWNNQTDELMGSIGAFNFEEKEGKQCIELGILLFEKFAGHGYGPEATMALEQALLNMGMDQIVLLIDDQNERSYKAAQKNGYTWNQKDIATHHNRIMRIYRKNREGR